MASVVLCTVSFDDRWFKEPLCKINIIMFIVSDFVTSIFTMLYSLTYQSVCYTLKKMYYHYNRHITTPLLYPLFTSFSFPLFSILFMGPLFYSGFDRSPKYLQTPPSPPSLQMDSVSGRKIIVTIISIIEWWAESVFFILDFY